MTVALILLGTAVVGFLLGRQSERNIRACLKEQIEWFKRELDRRALESQILTDRLMVVVKEPWATAKAVSLGKVSPHPRPRPEPNSAEDFGLAPEVREHA